MEFPLSTLVLFSFIILFSSFILEYIIKFIKTIQTIITNKINAFTKLILL